MVVPVGPIRTLDPGDSVTVLTALSVMTRLSDVTGDCIPITDPLPEGTVVPDPHRTMAVPGHEPSAHDHLGRLPRPVLAWTPAHRMRALRCQAAAGRRSHPAAMDHRHRPGHRPPSAAHRDQGLSGTHLDPRPADLKQPRWSRTLSWWRYTVNHPTGHICLPARTNSALIALPA